MKNYVVCIETFKGISVNGAKPHGNLPIKNEIYTVVRIYESHEKKGLFCYQLAELHPNDGWNIKKFRPVQNIDETIEWIEEVLLKQAELEEATN